MDAVFPAPASALTRGRRARRTVPRVRRRTQPVTFAEIKEVDEESLSCVGGGGERRRPDVVETAAAVEGGRRARRAGAALRELSPPAPARAASEPADTDT